MSDLHSLHAGDLAQILYLLPADEVLVEIQCRTGVTRRPDGEIRPGTVKWNLETMNGFRTNYWHAFIGQDGKWGIAVEASDLELTADQCGIRFNNLGGNFGGYVKEGFSRGGVVKPAAVPVFGNGDPEFFVPMSANRCDMVAGPCSCGAWHKTCDECGGTGAWENPISGQRSPCSKGCKVKP